MTDLEALALEIKEAIDFDKELVVLCIGTDRITGDSFGPLVGSMLQRLELPNWIHVYGSIQEPVSMSTFEEALSMINSLHSGIPILVVDCSIVSSEPLERVVFRNRGVKPGLGKIGVVGNWGLEAPLVNKDDFLFPRTALAQVRLFTVFQLANIAVEALIRAGITGETGDFQRMPEVLGMTSPKAKCLRVCHP